MPLRYTPDSNTSLRKYIKDYIDDHGVSCCLNHIDLSQIVSLERVFYHLDFDGDISEWNVSHIESFYQCFYGCTMTGIPHGIERWRLSSSADVGFMFSNSSINCDISTWPIDRIGLQRMGLSAHLNPSIVLLPSYYDAADDWWYDLHYRIQNAALWPALHLVHWQLRAMAYRCPDPDVDYALRSNPVHTAWTPEMEAHTMCAMSLLDHHPIQHCGHLLASSWRDSTATPLALDS